MPCVCCRNPGSLYAVCHIDAYLYVARVPEKEGVADCTARPCVLSAVDTSSIQQHDAARLFAKAKLISAQANFQMHECWSNTHRLTGRVPAAQSLDQDSSCFMQSLTIYAFQPGILDLGEVAGHIASPCSEGALLPFLVQVERLNGHTSLIEVLAAVLDGLFTT